ncbi:MAG: DUF1080 domain-containing protein [Acidobacteriales bacterium]|nr:MAG: DUF1080 domain-containing protein [Terriglobales bacterium]
MFSGFVKYRRGMTIALMVAAFAAAWAWLPQMNRAAAQQGPAAGRGVAAPDDNTGFEAIFDGKTLKNWDGEPGFWRVEDGTITGETTPERALKQNTFLLWRGGTVRDFELKVEFRLSASANSGIQYRSSIVAQVSQWALKGYQADMDGANSYTGMVYEERGRGFLAPRGRFNRMAEGGTSKQIAALGEADALKTFIKTGADWNQMHVIAKGNTLVHVINGHVMAAFLDEDSRGRAMEGLLGLQLHAGQPMKIEFRNIYCRKL